MGADIEKLVRQFQDHYGVLLATARRHAPSDLIYDIVQQVFIDFIRYASKGGLDAENDMTPLLIRMTKFRAIKLFEERKRLLPEVFLEVDRELAFEREPVGSEYWDDRLKQLRRCMKKLPQQSRDLLYQHYRLGISLEEISTRQGQKSSTVRSFFYRIRLKLRECIERHL